MAVEYPYTGMCFEMSANGVSLGAFSECAGLKLDVGFEEYAEGGVNHFTHLLPTHVKSVPVTLKRGITASKALWEWVSVFAEKSVVQPKTVQIALNGPDGGNLLSWVLMNAYPLKWEGPSLNALRPEIAFESIELVHQGISAGGGS